MTGSTPSDGRVAILTDGGRDVLITDGGEEEAPEEQEEGDEEQEEEGEEEQEEQEEEEEQEEAQGEEGEEEGEDYRDEEGATVLYLDLGEGLYLDLLGLEVDLERVELDVSAVSGENRLLGNLLDAVASLLDGMSLSAIQDKLEDAFGGITDGMRGMLGDVADELDLRDLLTQFLTSIVEEVIGGGDSSDSMLSLGEDEDEGGDEGSDEETDEENGDGE